MAAGLHPKEPQYGDVGALRELGVKQSPESSTPTFFAPQGGRPRQKGQFSAHGGALPQGSPPAPEDIPTEHEELLQRADDLAQASRAWSIAAQSPGATAKMKRVAMAVREAARIAVMQARTELPYERSR